MLSTRRTLLAGSCVCIAAAATTNILIPENEDLQVLCKLSDGLSIKRIGPLRHAPVWARQALDAVTGLVGMRPVFELREADFEKGWIAVAAKRGNTRYVIYDSKWFPIDDVGIGWYMITIFAHEIGHHLYGHTSGISESNHQDELDADRFGGWAVAKLGGTEAEALSFTPRLSSGGSSSHPARADRIDAYREGWRAGKGNLSASFT